MSSNEMTKNELILRFSTDRGYASEITSKYHINRLRDACNSGGAFNYIKNLEALIMAL